ncbi:MAG: bifunctional transaldolase/phosoglucose isomerase, partial [Anaerolineaceae bacterium]|nr:bifunctional transaldolase/phosoglucose isomerase [Anaerolineaceae bacterium]
MSKSKELHQIGQSIWFDNIDRQLINNNWFETQIKNGLFYGVTSNPSIFKKSITQSNEYTEDIQYMSWSGLSAREIYELLAIKDIKDVSDLLYPVYEASAKMDGYVSLEIDPALANDKDRTISEAMRLWKSVNKKNLMIKIPATKAGIFAIRELIFAGLNINVTLIFSVERYLDVIDAYFSGLEKRIVKNKPIDHIHSVASFFVSRLDAIIESKVDGLIATGKITENEVKPYLGKIAILNALYAYKEFVDSIHTARFKRIAENGGSIQRPLWASTSTKNPLYSGILYVNNLILPDTVNTIPPKTLSAFLDHGTCTVAVYSKARIKYTNIKKKMEEWGIEFNEIWIELEEEGVKKFKDAQEALIISIDEKRDAFEASIAGLGTGIKNRVNKLKTSGFVGKFFAPEASLFTNKDSEIDEVLHRFGWVDAPIVSKEIIPQAEALLHELLREGYIYAVVLGMGGSSLATEVFSRVFDDREENKYSGLHLSILDSTDPVQIDAKRREIGISKTLFIVSSKSGTTAEVRALLSYFWNNLVESGSKLPGKNFIAITDPGTPLEKLGQERKFRHIFIADPNVGGRYSALTAFGLVPAVLSGINGRALLNAASQMRKKCGLNLPIETNPGFVLAAVIVEAYKKGRDKITILSDACYAAVGSWMEQLIAESSGKMGKGFLPVDGEPRINANEYSNDRIFYYLRKNGKYDELVRSLIRQNHPVIVSYLDNVYKLTAEMYKWEIAIAVACSLIGVNPFNQPNVQESKSITHKMINAYKKDPVFNAENTLFNNDAIIISGPFAGKEEFTTAKFVVERFLNVKKGEYISI